METIAQLQQNSPEPLIITDHQGTVTNVNECFEKVFGWEKAEIVGMHVTVILPVNFRDAHHLGFSRFNMTGISTILNHPLKLKALTKNGQEIWSEHIIMAEKQDNSWIFAATLRPLPEEEN